MARTYTKLEDRTSKCDFCKRTTGLFFVEPEEIVVCEVHK